MGESKKQMSLYVIEDSNTIGKTIHIRILYWYSVQTDFNEQE